ncbi:DUF4352 domain-containing protein [Evansella cellulosilytica]|uniref:DUF4352 domain-containing protein n=1 Tax=Evansella cellulosilytica (strain ATCC 21833 / DSM 2522 / FERM P-1141 / JCM 9156 / N-4) TaxID=649639 RepID=E6TRF5_EVAC2|nr:DUF4352 domain-containing protein [Evansella cellulosilytica]ADU31785.1 hypothetical protein Bcell_3544 [Evansella cellulosilytica DSM 2522]
MRKLCLLIITSLIVFTVACGDSNVNDVELNDESTVDEETENIEQDDSYESKDEVLSIGDTGRMIDTLGEYEVTIHSVEITEEIQGNTPMEDVYVIVDLSIKNIGDEILEVQDIIGTHLFSDDDLPSGNMFYVDFIDEIDGEISYGETVSGQILFDQIYSEYYNLVFGWGLSTVSNELTWHFTRDEVNE